VGSVSELTGVHLEAVVSAASATATAATLATATAAARAAAGCLVWAGVFGADDDAAEEGLAQAEGAHVWVVLEGDVNDAPFLGAHGLEAHAAAGLLCLVGEAAGHVFEGGAAAVDVSFDVNDEALGVFVGIAARDDAVDDVLDRAEGAAFAPDEDGGVFCLYVEAGSAVFEAGEADDGLDAHLADDFLEQGGGFGSLCIGEWREGGLFGGARCFVLRVQLFWGDVWGVAIFFVAWRTGGLFGAGGTLGALRTLGTRGALGAILVFLIFAWVWLAFEVRAFRAFSAGLGAALGAAGSVGAGGAVADGDAATLGARAAVGAGCSSVVFVARAFDALWAGAAIVAVISIVTVVSVVARGAVVAILAVWAVAAARSLATATVAVAITVAILGGFLARVLLWGWGAFFAVALFARGAVLLAGAVLVARLWFGAALGQVGQVLDDEADAHGARSESEESFASFVEDFDLVYFVHLDPEFFEAILDGVFAGLCACFNGSHA